MGIVATGQQSHESIGVPFRPARCPTARPELVEGSHPLRHGFNILNEILRQSNCHPEATCLGAESKSLS